MWAVKTARRAIGAGQDALKMHTLMAYFCKHRGEICESLLDVLTVLKSTYREPDYAEQFERAANVVDRLTTGTVTSLIEAFTTKHECGSYNAICDSTGPIDTSLFEMLIPGMMQSLINALETVAVNAGLVQFGAITYLAERFKRHAKLLVLHLGVVKRLLGDPPEKGTARVFYDKVVSLGTITNQWLKKLQTAIDKAIDLTVGLSEYKEEIPLPLIGKPDESEIENMRAMLENEILRESSSSSSSSSSEEEVPVAQDEEPIKKKPKISTKEPPAVYSGKKYSKKNKKTTT